ncbi:MAG: branched-chain amino acid ABC transporter permease [Actinomycetota bacterium]|nr:branched-chain amino acid ABC transporter permease [Actinomycetota bacterium]
MRRTAGPVLALLIAVLAGLLVVLGGSPALAGAAEERINGTLRNGEQVVADVRIVATRPDGSPVGETRSGPDGRWAIPLPGPGSYRVTLDEATLPEGVGIRPDTTNTRDVEVVSGGRRAVLFPLGQGARQSGPSQLSRAATLTVEGLRFGLILALAAVGLSLIFGTTGLTNFAHGELITLGGLVAYFVNVILDIHLVPATILTVIACGLAGALLDLGFWRRLRRRGTGLIAMMIVSIGLSILVRYVYLYVFGGSTRPYADYALQGSLPLGPVVLAPKDLASMLIAAFVLVLAGFALLRTRIGKATRAVADNPALAAASGIDVERVIQAVWIGGAALAGLSGVLLGINQQVDWQMGFQVLLLVFAAVTLGGLGTAFGALVGSLIVGLFIQLSTLVVPPELKNVGALAVLILILLVRPQGILGRAQRVG